MIYSMPSFNLGELTFDLGLPQKEMKLGCVQWTLRLVAVNSASCLACNHGNGEIAVICNIVHSVQIVSAP